MKLSIKQEPENRVVSWLTEQVKEHQQLDEKTTLKVKLGMEMILLSIPKFLVIYGIALSLHLFFEVLIFDCAYYCLRRKAYGAHATSNSFCLVLSILIFIGIPYMSHYFTLSSWVVVVMFIINSLILSVYAPAPTKKNPIYCNEKKRRLRLESLFYNSGLFLLAMVIPIMKIRFLICLGATLSGWVVLPIFKGGNER